MRVYDITRRRDMSVCGIMKGRAMRMYSIMGEGA